MTPRERALQLLAQAEDALDIGEIAAPETAGRMALAQAYALLAVAHALTEVRDEIARLPGS